MNPRKPSKLDLGVNIAILVTLAIVLLGPSGVIGSRIVTTFQAWKAQRAIAEVWPTLTDARSRIAGSGDLSNRTVVEFVDYECSICRQIAEEVSDAAASHDVDLVIRHLPLDGHRDAGEPALAAVCSEKQSVFEQAHQALLLEDDWMEESDWVA